MDFALQTLPRTQLQARLAQLYGSRTLEPAPSLFCVASSIDQDKIKFKKPLGNRWRWLAELNPNSEVGLVLVLDESVFSTAKRARVSRNYMGPNSTLAIAKDFCVRSRSLEMFLILAWFGLLKIPSESI